MKNEFYQFWKFFFNRNPIEIATQLSNLGGAPTTNYLQSTKSTENRNEFVEAHSIDEPGYAISSFSFN